MLSADPNSLIQPTAIGTRETLLYEQALEAAYGRPYASLLHESQEAGACDAADLLHLGRRLFMDFVRLARGEISGIGIPAKFPRKATFLAS